VVERGDAVNEERHYKHPVTWEEVHMVPTVDKWTVSGLGFDITHTTYKTAYADYNRAIKMAEQKATMQQPSTRAKDLIAALASYDFRDPQGHPLTGCKEWREWAATVEDQRISKLVACAKIADELKNWQVKTDILTLIGGLVTGDAWRNDRVEMIADTLEPNDKNLPLHAALMEMITR
jgi:hypothetical protein